MESNAYVESRHNVWAQELQRMHGVQSVVLFFSPYSCAVQWLLVGIDLKHGALLNLPLGSAFSPSV